MHELFLTDVGGLNDIGMLLFPSVPTLATCGQTEPVSQCDEETFTLGFCGTVPTVVVLILVSEVNRDRAVLVVETISNGTCKTLEGSDGSQLRYFVNPQFHGLWSSPECEGSTAGGSDGFALLVESDASVFRPDVLLILLLFQTTHCILASLLLPWGGGGIRELVPPIVELLG